MAWFLPGVLKNLFGGPATRLYPFDKREPYKMARGHIEIDINTCVFCGACMKRCPAAAITVERESRTYYFEPFRCIICEECVQICPKKSITLYDQWRSPAYAKNVEVYHGAPLPPKPAPAPKPAE